MKDSKLLHPAVITSAVLVLAFLQACPFATPKNPFWAQVGACQAL